LQFAMKSRKHKAFCQATTHLVQAWREYKMVRLFDA
jgi:hypothetical protein